MSSGKKPSKDASKPVKPTKEESPPSKEKKETKPDVVLVKASSCWLEASRKSYAPGETVELVAHLNLKRKFTTVFAVIEGVAKARVYDSRGCHNTAKRILEGFEYLLTNPAAGLYSIPLHFTLPHDLPNSFEYSHLQNELAVDYSVKIHADDEILVLSKLVVYRPVKEVPNYPKSVLDKKTFRDHWFSFKDSVVAWNMEVDSNTYAYGEFAKFSFKSSSRELKNRIKQVYGGLFMIITGKGPLAGIQMVVPRNETKSSTEEYPLNFEVPVKPSFIEQPTDCSLFKVDYGVGILVDKTGMYGIQPIAITTGIAVPNSLYYSDAAQIYQNEIAVGLKLTADKTR